MLFQQLRRRGARAYSKLVFGRHSKLIATALPSLGEPLAAAPVPSDWIVEGTPEARSRVLVTSGDGGLSAGLWHCTRGAFQWHFECDELIYVLSGGVEVEHAGALHRLGPGELAYFPIGASTRWTVRDHIRKLYVHRHPAPITRRLLGLTQ